MTDWQTRRKAKQERMRAVRRFVRLITWRRLERGGDLPHARDEAHADGRAAHRRRAHHARRRLIQTA